MDNVVAIVGLTIMVLGVIGIVVGVMGFIFDWEWKVPISRD